MVIWLCCLFRGDNTKMNKFIKLKYNFKKFQLYTLFKVGSKVIFNIDIYKEKYKKFLKKEYLNQEILKIIDHTFNDNGDYLVILSNGTLHKNPYYLIKVK